MLLQNNQIVQNEKNNQNTIEEDIIKSIFNKYRDLYNLKETNDE